MWELIATAAGSLLANLFSGGDDAAADSSWVGWAIAAGLGFLLFLVLIVLAVTGRK